MFGLVACSDYGFKGWDDTPEHEPADTASPLDGRTPAGEPPEEDIPIGVPGPDTADTDDPLEDSGGPSDPVDPLALGAVQGRVCDPSGEGWVAGALVYAWFDLDGDAVSDGRRSDVTDGSGRFLLDDLPPGPTTVYVEKGSFTVEFEVTIVANDVTEVSEDTCLERDSVHIAVITGMYDDIGAILTAMTIPYTSFSGIESAEYVDFLRDPAAMAEFDIIFINCGQHTEWWPHAGEVGNNLRNYVMAGGNLYASDWAYYMLEVSFPDLLDYYGDDSTAGAAAIGDPGEHWAEVIDPYMQALLGTSVAELNFDYNAWAIPVSPGPDTRVLVRGTARIEGSSATVIDSPLTVRSDPGGGVIFTAFHNESQATMDMETMLREIVLSL